MAYDEWNADLLMKFRQFVQDEYNFVDQYPEIYGEINRRDIPKEKRKANSVANEMQVLKSFFNELVDMEEIQRSPFSKISREKRKAITRKKYDAPVYLRKEEFKTLRELSPKKTLAETHEAFLLHCALGCRIGDFQNMTMENVGVSEDGIPYIHYLPQKTRETQNDNKEIVTPLVRFAFEIIKKTRFNLPILKYPSGKSGYNKKIKELLKQAGIDRLVAEYDEETGTNKYIPLYEAASSKLARKTMVDMMSKVQVNLYAAGLHREGSDAVNRYTQLEIKDRFSLMNTAFGEKEYKVDKYLNVIE
jgi:site-specific recombinase XerD